ncbi:MAG TPA: AAA family ATPase [Candidatus Saccharimonadales bacterium]
MSSGSKVTMLDDLILHEATHSQLAHFITKPSHALLLTGPTGIGKTAIAEAIAAAVLEIEPKKLASYPYLAIVRPDGNSISIDAVRQLQKFLQLKTVGEKPFRRTIIIEYAHLLTIEAQNAFLKLLEEPPTDTVTILTASSPRALLPTILSRAQTIAITAPTEEQLKIMLDKSQKGDNAVKQAYFLSGGLPGLLHALLDGNEEHPLLASVAQAKAVLQKQPFERLAMLDTMSKQKESALGVVDALERIAQAGLTGASAKKDLVRIKQWHRVRKASLEARNQLRSSANAKLVLSKLFLNM